MKLIFKVLTTGTLLLCTTAVLLVRFTGLTISDNRKALLDYNEESGEWVINNWEVKHLKGIDGPYVFTENNALQFVRVVEKGDKLVLEKKKEALDSINIFTVVVDNQAKDQFAVRFQKKHLPQPSVLPQPEKLIAISDIEGNFEAFQGFLQANGVIDEKMHWSFGAGQLVLVGDFMDRGNNVTQVLWLIYQLEQEANLAGGKVHFILGNHEAMNLQNNYRYVNKKYIAIAQKVADVRHYNQAYSLLMSDDNELVRWLKTKNLMLKIGDFLFVHAGISPELIDSGLSIDDINEIGKKTITQKLYNQTEGDPQANLIAGPFGPLWYRGLVIDYKDYYKKASEDQVDNTLYHFGVNHIVVGHTLVESVSSDYNNKVIRIDVKHGKQKTSEKTQGLLIENAQLYKIDGRGNNQPITQ